MLRGNAAGAPLPSGVGLGAVLGGIVKGGDAKGGDAKAGDVSAAVMDADSGRMLYGYRADQAMPPASTDKIATALAVLERLPATQRLVTSVVEGGGGGEGSGGDGGSGAGSGSGGDSGGGAGSGSGSGRWA